MKLHIAPPDTAMVEEVLRVAQECADLLDRTQFMVIDRRTHWRVMPRMNAGDSTMTTTDAPNAPGAQTDPSSSVAVAEPAAEARDVRRRVNMAVSGLHTVDEDNAMDDNLAIALATYYSKHSDCPDPDEVDEETGWGKWTLAKSRDLLDRITAAAIAAIQQEHPP